MLDINPGNRYNIDQCLEHPWVTGRNFAAADSFSSVTERMHGLGFTRRRVDRERTLLAQAPGLRNTALQNPSQAPATGARATAGAAQRPTPSNGTAKGNGKDKGKAPASPAKAPAPAAAADGSLDPSTKAFVNIGGKGVEETLYSNDGSP